MIAINHYLCTIHYEYYEYYYEYSLIFILQNRFRETNMKEFHHQSLNNQHLLNRGWRENCMITNEGIYLQKRKDRDKMVGQDRTTNTLLVSCNHIKMLEKIHITLQQGGRNSAWSMRGSRSTKC